MRILSRRPQITDPNEYLPWLPTETATPEAERRLRCRPGTARAVMDELIAAARPARPRLFSLPLAAVRPGCRILAESANDAYVRAVALTVDERLAALGLAYAKDHRTVNP